MFRLVKHKDDTWAIESDKVNVRGDLGLILTCLENLGVEGEELWHGFEAILLKKDEAAEYGVFNRFIRSYKLTKAA